MRPLVSGEYLYDIAISFAGENRAVALQLFELLKAKNIKVFYDFDEQANLWGKDLIEHLSDVYANQARYCLMLISKYYPEKPWTRLERRSAQSRAFRQPEEYILPVRLDSTEVPGLPDTVAYLDLRRQSIEDIADQVVKKLGRQARQEQMVSSSVSQVGAAKLNIPLPQVSRAFTQLDKDRFIEKAFEVMKSYFRQALSDLQRQYPQTETDLKEITSEKFVARVYIHGDLRCMCKIWLGNGFGSQAIQYLEGPRIDIDRDNSMNDYLMVDTTPSELGLKISSFGFGIGVQKPDHDIVSPEQGAEYLWRRFTASLK